MVWNLSRTSLALGVLSITLLQSDQASASSCASGPGVRFEVATLTPATDGPLSEMSLVFSSSSWPPDSSSLRIETADGVGLTVAFEPTEAAP